MNPTALVPVTQPGDLRQDRVGQLVQRVLDGVASEETCRAYAIPLEMFLGFCGQQGNPTLSAELLASYRASLVGEGKSSSTVGVHKIDLSQIDFGKLRDEFAKNVPRKHATLQDIRDVIEAKLRQNVSP